MRAAGTLLTVLALLAVQAPWIACTCDDAAACTPLLTTSLLHEDHAHDEAHPHGCCDALAHAVHGRGHAHGRHCHGTFAHEHAHGHDRPHDVPGEKPERDEHEGFRLSYVAMPGPVQLKAPVAAPFLVALRAGDTHAPLFERRGVRIDPEPPDRPRVPAAATERLLL